ncbi:MAG: SMP-30/gluconolactonase/LRE family protein [Myxococcota bacterium]
MIRKVAAAALLVVTAAVLFLYLSSPLEPAWWEPPAHSPLTGAYAPNDRLTPVEWWAKQLVGPEAITLNTDGTLLAGLKDGRVVKLKLGVDEPEVLFDTKGRPLAMAWHPDGRLIVCDAHAGLLAYSRDGKVEVLATTFGGVPFRFVDDLAITKDGVIYFSDASARFSIEGFTEDLIEHQFTGRVLRYVPATKELALVADGFAFANGVALSGDESYLVVSETGSYRLWRLRLTGERAGKKELFTDSLPGFPDNVRWSPSRQGFWVAIGSPRKAIMDGLAHWPRVRRLVGALPKSLQPKPARHSYVLLVDANGKPVESFQRDAPDSYSPVACATEADGWLYLGSFAREGVARFKLP